MTEQGNDIVESSDEVLIVPIDDEGYALLVVEPSPAFGGEVLVLPGGQVEHEEWHTVTANRELQEEVGFRAGRLDFLGEFRPFSKYIRLRSYIYLAQRLMPNKLQGDEDYEIKVQKVSLTRFESLIAARKLVDCRAITALYLARSYLQNQTNT